MLETLFGEIKILINGSKIDYQSIELDNEEKNFKVDKRYKIVVNIRDFLKNKSNEIIVESILLKNAIDNVERCVESGERLAMLSFYSGNKKVSIGVEDELPGILCTYGENGVKVFISSEAQIEQITFGIAWITMNDFETQDLYTWFAADPTLYKAYRNIREQNKE